MKSNITALFMIATLCLTACGAQRAISPNDNSPKVQTTFFGAKFGEKGESVIKNRMSFNKAGDYWHAGEKGQWIMNDVSFAGNEWDVMFVYFIGERFSRISFANRYSTKAEAMKQFDKLHELFSNKYPLRKETFNGKYENLYNYIDSSGNMVSITVLYMDEANYNPWLCYILYTWGKGVRLAQKEALNEI